ncbi:TPA: DUF2971 domain-containing protein [Klebsiella pneumoniae]|nr:DUF2971 domain-containing protein [Klebsiella pneumoniae]
MELYHYTTLDGFLGIINENALWATNIKHLNDSSELSHGIHILEQSIDHVKNNSNINHEWIEEIKKQIKVLDSTSAHDIYVTCFLSSVKPNGEIVDGSDLLSQWRGYSKSQQGICIVFEHDRLINFLSSQQNQYIKEGEFYNRQFDIYYGPVQYINHDSAINAAEYLVREKESYLSIIDIFLRNDLARQGITRTELYNITPLIKDEGFKEENEYRVIYHTITNRTLVRYRSNGDYLIPYISIGNKPELNNNTMITNILIPIKRIVIGPHQYSTLNAHTIKSMIEERCIMHTPIEISKIPYRG